MGGPQTQGTLDKDIKNSQLSLVSGCFINLVPFCRQIIGPTALNVEILHLKRSPELKESSEHIT